MPANDNTEERDLRALEEAADWMDRLDELTEADQQALKVWLRASSDNAEAFDRMRRTILDPALLVAAERVQQPAPAVAAPAPHRLAPPARQVRRGGRWGLIAATVAGLGVAAVVGLRISDRAAEPPLQLATAVGARSDYGLSDRSVVHLNADSQVSVRFNRTARNVTLQKGDAMFDVAKNPHRPFNVAVGVATVTAVGTSFEVDRMADAVEVRVFEGVVRVSRPDGPAYLARKGEWLRLTANSRPVGGQFAPDLDQTWRSDWLVAEQTPLKYVVARLNRYSADQIVVRDPAVGELKVTGRFRLSRPTDALAMISALIGVDAARNGQYIVVAPRAPNPPIPRTLRPA